MSFNIYLSGGGKDKDTFELDELFLRASGKRILYIPVGLKRTFAGYDECVKWFMNMISSHKLTKQVSVWISIKDKTEQINVRNFDAVYIGGASDTFRLHCMLSEHNFYEKFRTFIEEGGVIYGGSAGSSILGKSINYDQMEKALPKLKEYSSDLCLGYSVFPHLNPQNEKIIDRMTEGRVLGIPEEGGCMIDTFNKKITYIGASRAKIINEFQSRNIQNGETINMVTLEDNES